VKLLKVNVRRAHNRRKLGDHYQQELKRLTHKLLSAKRNAQETFLRSLLQNEGKSWTEFYRYVKRRKGNRENTPTIRNCNGGHITDPVEKENNLNNYYAFVFSHEGNIPEIKISHWYEPFTIKISIIGKRLAMIGRNKSVGPDDIPGDTLKMGGEALIPYLLFLAYVNEIWRNIESKIRLFADDCIIYRKIVNNYDVEKLQIWIDWGIGR
jgi:hypothetical protein